MTQEKNSLIKKIEYDCPICNKVHTIQIRQRVTEALVKNEIVEYEQIYYHCDIQDEEFVPAQIMDENLLKARNAYRIKHALLTSEQIKEIRQYYGLSQKELSNLLGWGDITIQRYERKLIQDETYDSMIRMIYNNPAFALESLEKHKNSFENNRYNELKEVIKKYIRQEGNALLKQQEILNAYIDFDKETDLNGYKILDVKKVGNIIAYFANYVNKLYKVKLMKLLWYSDSIYFKKHGQSMTGLVYQHMPLGAVPIAFNEIIYLPTVKIVEELINDDTAYKIVPIKEVNISEFKLDELEVLQEVAARFKNTRGSEISNYMHKEKAYTETEDSQIIPYSLAKEVYAFNIE